MADFNDYSNLITNQIGILEIAHEYLEKDDLPEDIRDAFLMISTYATDSIEIVKKFYNEFIEIKNKQGEYDDKKEQFDKLFSEINQIMIKKNLINSYENYCRDEFKDIWVKLDENSKKYIITARYLFKSIQRVTIDCSPAILEICRSFENELKSKIFNLIQNDHFVSLQEMIDTLHSCTYKPELEQILLDKNWDLYKLSDNNFYNRSKNYKDNYRNKSAHPSETKMNEVDWNKCIALTKILLSLFLQCQNITK